MPPAASARASRSGCLTPSTRSGRGAVALSCADRALCTIPLIQEAPMTIAPTDITAAERQAALLATADRVLAGGGLGLFTLPPDVNLVIAEGHGSHVTDVAGRDFIDYHLGSGPALLGHGHPAVTAAVAAQLARGTT